MFYNTKHSDKFGRGVFSSSKRNILRCHEESEVCFLYGTALCTYLGGVRQFNMNLTGISRNGVSEELSLV